MSERRDFPSGRQDQYMVRFPDGMRERLKAAAAADGRSLNAEIVHRLARSFGKDAVAPPPRKELGPSDSLTQMDEIEREAFLEAAREASIAAGILLDAATRGAPVTEDVVHLLDRAASLAAETLGAVVERRAPYRYDAILVRSAS